MCAILIIINLFKTNALEDEHLLSPDKIYLAKKLTDRDSPKRSTYTSPTLKFLFKKLIYFIQPRTRLILTKLTYGMGPTSQELPNQLVLQTGHRNT